jgi:hypothetical protein
VAAIAPVVPPERGVSILSGYPWEGVARLVDRAPSAHDLRVHRLELLAAALYRERGLPVPPELASEALLAHMSTLAATAVLRRIRDACSGPLMLFKGLETSARYPGPGLRPLGDVDMLAADPFAVQRELEAVGFESVRDDLDWDELHHLPRLGPPDRLFAVEVHKRPKWVAGLQAPSAQELFADAVPSATGVEGILAPAPAVHAMILAAHAWAERPLGCIGDLVDVVVMADGCADGEVEDFVRRYGLARAWKTTTAAADALFADGATTWPLRSWARQLPDARERTVFESHLQRLLADFSALPPGRALRSAGRSLSQTVLPTQDEPWRAKLSRAKRAVRNAGTRRSEHERSLRDREEPDE